MHIKHKCITSSILLYHLLQASHNFIRSTWKQHSRPTWRRLRYNHTTQERR